MLRKIIVVLLLSLIFTQVSLAQNLKVNDQPVNEGDNLNLFFENLQANKIVFSLEAGNLKKAEITFDKGRSWLEMEQQGDNFVYGYRPLTNEVFFPEMLLTDKNSSVQTYRPNLRINYQKEKPDAQLGQFLEKFKSFYEDENKERFLSLFSTRYPDRVKFEQAIQNDFYNYKNMRLFYRIDTRAFDDDLEGAIWNVYWQRKYQDRNGNDLDESTANIAMRFDKEGGHWLITGLRNNTIFGSSLLSNPDLSITSSDVSVVATNVGPSCNATVTFNVHNIGTASVSSVKVNVYYKMFGAPVYPAVASGTATISSINTNSQNSGTVIITGLGIGLSYDFKVVVDPDGTITEDNENNNSAEKTNVAMPV